MCNRGLIFGCKGEFAVALKVLSLVLALAAGPALAQDPAPSPAPPPPRPAASAEQTATASAAADRLIAEGNAGEFFVNTSRDGLIRAKHVPSGMECSFVGNGRDRITILPQVSPQIPRGYDVSCNSYHEDLDIDLTLYATRYRPLPSEQQIVASAAAAIRQRWPDATPVQGGVPSISAGDKPPPLVAAFNVVVNGRPSVTAAFVSHRGEWGYKARATGPSEPDMAVTLFGNVMLMGAMFGIDFGSVAD